MKEITIRLYDYDELSPEAKERALEEWRSGDVEHFWGHEVEDTLTKLQEELGIEVSRWKYSPYGHDVGVIRFPRYTDDQLDLAGRRAQAFLWNRFDHLIVQPRRHMSRESKVFFDRTYDGSCPLTGVCFDNDALGPLGYFCFGVEWDEKEKKRVMIPQSKRTRWAVTTVEDVLRDCVDALLRSAQNDWNYQFTEEYFADHARNNGFAFDESGHRRDDL